MNWKTHFNEALKSTNELNEFFNFNFDPVSYSIFLPRPLAEAIKSKGIHSPLGLQFLPHKLENELDSGLFDPIGDKEYSKGGQLIHRYQNRALFTPTTVCPVHCRYCFRKNELNEKDPIFKNNFLQTIAYLNQHPEINEIIFTGGDPLILSNEKLSYYLEEFSKIPTIHYIRFHTRTPIILPSRIDSDFLNLINLFQKKFKKILFMIHTNHYDELQLNHVKEALLLLNDSQIKLFSQTVLLKNVNDTTTDLYNLFLELIDLNVTPYYLHHPDQTRGAMHFTLTLEEGRKIFHPLHNLLPGWAIPTYVIDLPNGGGKITAQNPETFLFKGELLNRFGQVVKI